MHLTLLPYHGGQRRAEDQADPALGQGTAVHRHRARYPRLPLRRADPEKEREKLALFCNVRPTAVIAAYDLKSIYEAPLAYHREGLDQAVLDAFQISPAPESPTCPLAGCGRPHPQRRGRGARRHRRQVHAAGRRLQVHQGGADPWRHGQPGQGQGGMGRCRDLRARGPGAASGRLPRILVPGGFGERGTEGKIRAAQFARERNVPYLGICLGMQMAVIEAARNLAGSCRCRAGGVRPRGRQEALSPRWSTTSRNGCRATRRSSARSTDDKGGTMRLGAYDAVLKEGSRVAEIYGTDHHRRTPPPPLRGRHQVPRRSWRKGLSSPACRPTGGCPRSWNGRITRGSSACSSTPS
jgi:CTP synthase